jgi:uncharacterized protein (TIGR03083 family)
MDHAAALVDENAHFAALAAAADPGTPVPTCPGWSLKQLFRHVGRGDRWAATIVRTGLPADPREVADGRPPEGGLVDWLQGGPQAILDAVAEAGPDTPVWTFNGPRPASWWIRRREHEVLVHRADAALALGADFVVPAERAADSVSEWLGLLADRPFEPADHPLADGATLHLHATDEGLGPAGEWFVRGAGERIAWEHGHAKGDVAVRGPVADLLLALLRRRPSDTVETIGDAAVWERWLAKTGF